MKNTSTVLEPSIHFHTLVHLVDAEGIPDDKLRTHDLTHEVIYITKQFQTQTPHSSQHDQLMFTHPVFHVAKLEHKTTPAPFDVTYKKFNRDPRLRDLAYYLLQHLLRPRRNYFF